MNEFQIGDRVKKLQGYGYPGIIVASFPTLKGEQRYVVEAIGAGYEGMLHIFNGNQLEKVV